MSLPNPLDQSNAPVDEVDLEEDVDFSPPVFASGGEPACDPSPQLGDQANGGGLSPLDPNYGLSPAGFPLAGEVHDDFADAPEYLEIRRKWGPMPEFEKARAYSLQKAVRPWTLNEWQRIVDLRSTTLETMDPVSVARYCRNLLQALESGGKAPARRFDEQITPLSVFLAREVTTTFLVEDVLPAGQICIAGGPEKGQKSNLLIDLAVSLASGKPWLGRFAVPRPVRVLLLSGETQGANLQNIIRRVCEAKELTPHKTDGRVMVNGIDDRLVIKEALPSLADDEDLIMLGQIVGQEQPEVVILDPLYLTLARIDTFSLTQVGESIEKAAKVCTQAGATPVFAHHMSKSAQMRRGEEREPMQLADLNGAGFGPVAGSWLLVNYLDPYDPNTGRCTLWLNIGGRAGHGGLYTVAIDEAAFRKDLPLNGRKWTVEVKGGQKAIETAEQVKAKQKEAKDASKVRAKEYKEEELMDKIRQWLSQREPDGAIQNDIASAVGIKPQLASTLLIKMRERGWAVTARKREGDNRNARRWRSPGAVMVLPVANKLKLGGVFEDVWDEHQKSQLHLQDGTAG